jgi:precorrin-8X/cobalt-precorrin-8 methylmutase
VDYLRDPEAIYRQSFAAIREATDLSRLPESLRPVALRMVHACGLPAIVDDLAWRGDPASAAREALAAGKPLFVDAAMVAAGITRHAATCCLNDPRTPDLARRLCTTRSAAAVDLWRDGLDGAVVAIGNAPTALFRLLEILAEPKAPLPAAVFAFPVGFVGAADSKDALIATDATVPFVTLRGRFGGSALAAAAINALCHENGQGSDVS